jgi:hypothetical protein
MTKAQEAEKKLLDDMESEYSEKVYAGAIAFQMKRLFKQKARTWSPFKMGYFCALLLQPPIAKK